jgi:hypothetical protein
MSPSYSMKLVVTSNWMVGYAIEFDEMFLYYVDENDITWVFRQGGLDAAGFGEYMNLDKALLLGDL